MIIAYPRIFVNEATAEAIHFDADFNAVSAVVNGNIENDNIAAAAAIAPTKIQGTAIVAGNTNVLMVGNTIPVRDAWAGIYAAYLYNSSAVSPMSIRASCSLELYPDIAAFSGTYINLDADANRIYFEVLNDKGIYIRIDNGIYLFPDYDDDSNCYVSILRDGMGDTTAIKFNGTTEGIFDTSAIACPLKFKINAVTKLMVANDEIDCYVQLVLKSYTVAGAGGLSGVTGAMIYVTDETGGAVPAFYDGTNWRRVTDRVIIS